MNKNIIKNLPAPLLLSYKFINPIFSMQLKGTMPSVFYPVCEVFQKIEYLLEKGTLTHASIIFKTHCIFFLFSFPLYQGKHGKKKPKKSEQVFMLGKA
jgi:hypothetical protein